MLPLQTVETIVRDVRTEFYQQGQLGERIKLVATLSSTVQATAVYNGWPLFTPGLYGLRFGMSYKPQTPSSCSTTVRPAYRASTLFQLLRGNFGANVIFADKVSHVKCVANS